MIQYLVILEQGFIFNLFYILKCSRNVIKGFMAPSHSNAIRMYVIVTLSGVTLALDC